MVVWFLCFWVSKIKLLCNETFYYLRLLAINFNFVKKKHYNITLNAPSFCQNYLIANNMSDKKILNFSDFLKIFCCYHYSHKKIFCVFFNRSIKVSNLYSMFSKIKYLNLQITPLKASVLLAYIIN